MQWIVAGNISVRVNSKGCFYSILKNYSSYYILELDQMLKRGFYV